MPVKLWKIAQLYYECVQLGTSPKKWKKTKVVPINMMLFLFTCYFLWSFFITLMFVYLQKLLHCLIVYSYKTNPSFLPCPWNLRYIEPSEFNFLLKNLNIHIWYNLCTVESFVLFIDCLNDVRLATWCPQVPVPMHSLAVSKNPLS